MKESKFTEEQIVYALKQAEAGVAVDELCRKYGISTATFYRWCDKYGGLGAAELERGCMIAALRASGGARNRAADLIEMPLRT